MKKNKVLSFNMKNDIINSMKMHMSIKSVVYFLILKDEIVYVGSASVLLKRICEHISENEKEFDRALAVHVSKKYPGRDNNGALQIEMSFMRYLKPRYNFKEQCYKSESTDEDYKVVRSFLYRSSFSFEDKKLFVKGETNWELVKDRIYLGGEFSGPLTVKKISKNDLAPGRYHDSDGLFLQVVNAKNRSWLFNYESKGKRVSMGLGPLHTFSLEEARVRVREARVLLKKGIDPLQHRKEIIKKNESLFTGAQEHESLSD